MDQSTHDVQQDREDTRAAISEKIELLEERVWDTVEEAKVSVRQRFKISHHVHRRPWQMLGLSILAGYVIGRSGAPRTDNHRFGPARELGRQLSSSTSEEGVYRPGPTGQSQSLREEYRDELGAIKKAALGVLTSLALGVIKEFLPETRSEASANGRSADQERAVDARGEEDAVEPVYPQGY